jgi:hypothetical protein
VKNFSVGNLDLETSAESIRSFSRLANGLLGPFLLWTARREERRFADGVTSEPGPIVDRRNWVPRVSRPAMRGMPQSANIPFPATEPR